MKIVDYSVYHNFLENISQQPFVCYNIISIATEIFIKTMEYGGVYCLSKH